MVWWRVTSVTSVTASGAAGRTLAVVIFDLMNVSQLFWHLKIPSESEHTWTRSDRSDHILHACQRVFTRRINVFSLSGSRLCCHRCNCVCIYYMPITSMFKCIDYVSFLLFYWSDDSDIQNVSLSLVCVILLIWRELLLIKSGWLLNWIIVIARKENLNGLSWWPLTSGQRSKVKSELLHMQLVLAGS